jgi:dihydroorotate dehydrogenase electron transfer subunit
MGSLHFATNGGALLLSGGTNRAHQRLYTYRDGQAAMLRAVAEITERHAVPAEVSLETPMACGIGSCFSCVAQVFDGQGRADFRHVRRGPVFDARRIKWD